MAAGVIRGGIGLALWLVLAPPAWGQPPELPLNVADVAAPEHPGWQEFLKSRLQVGVGFDESYHRNVLLTRGASRQDSFLTTLEAQAAFADPHGDWLYGGTYEVNAFRYHDLDQNGIHHEWRLFAHYTPLTRWRLALTEQYQIDDRLIGEVAQTDEVRRFAAITRAASNTTALRGIYDLNETNALRLDYAWSTVDDQAPDDGNVDHHTHQAVLALDHDLSRRWTVFGGYTFTSTVYPSASTKDLQSSGVELGTKYDLDPSTTGQLTADIVQRDVSGAAEASLEVDLALTLTRWVSPRSHWSLTAERRKLPSAGASATGFDSTYVTVAAAHAMTPLIAATWGGTYEHQAAGATRTDHWTTTLGVTWQLRPNVQGLVEVRQLLFSQENLSNTVVTVGLEVQL